MATDMMYRSPLWVIDIASSISSVFWESMVTKNGEVTVDPWPIKLCVDSTLEAVRGRSCRQLNKWDSIHVHRVARAPLKSDVLLEKLRVMDTPVTQVRLGRHHAENAAQSIITEGIGVMRTLPRCSDGTEDLIRAHVMYWQPLNQVNTELLIPIRLKTTRFARPGDS